jgi:hypothetical protein
MGWPDNVSGNVNANLIMIKARTCMRRVMVTWQPSNLTAKMKVTSYLNQTWPGSE